MFDLLFGFPRPMRYFVRLGKGRAVSARSTSNSSVIVKMERKITPEFVSGGKLLPATRFKRRGGKMHTDIVMSLEAAEALQKTLKAAIKDARRARRRWSVLDFIWFFVNVQDQSKA